jgi:hypothetical protein
VTAGPLDVQAIADRLAAQVAALRRVVVTQSLAEVQEGQIASPQASVLLATETGAPRAAGSGANRQRVTATVGIVLALEQYPTDRGTPGTELGALVTATRTALLSWRPPGADSSLQFVTGRAITTGTGLALWVESYRCEYWITTP